MKTLRKGMVTVESLMIIAVGAMIFLGMTQFWNSSPQPRSSHLAKVVLGLEQEEKFKLPDFSRTTDGNSNNLGSSDEEQIGVHSDQINNMSPFVDNLSIQDAKSASDLAYSSELGEETESGLKVVRVKELDSGFRVVVLIDPENPGRPPVVAFAGTHTDKWGKLGMDVGTDISQLCLLYTSPSPRDATLSRMPSSA